MTGHKIKLPKGYKIGKSGKVKSSPVYRNLIHKLQSKTKTRIKRGKR